MWSLCFRQAFDLLEFDIQELEESLLLMGTEDDTTKLVLRLLVKLLRGCSKSFTSNINEDVSDSFQDFVWHHTQFLHLVDVLEIRAVLALHAAIQLLYWDVLSETEGMFIFYSQVSSS